MNNFNLVEFIKAIQSSQNPEQMFESLMMSNSQVRNTIQQVQNSTQGASPKDIALQLAKQKGISEQDIMKMYSMFSGKK